MLEEFLNYIQSCYTTNFFELEYLFRIFMAGILSALIGIEREVHGRPVGMRTCALVGVGSALFMVISVIVAGSIQVIPGTPVPDPGRIAAQIVTGIGFLGAGAILKYGYGIRGLTTASCLWVVSAIGMAVGFGEIFLGTCITLGSLLFLIVLAWISSILPVNSYRTLLITKKDYDFKDVIKSLKKVANIKTIEFDSDYKKQRHSISVDIKILHYDPTDKTFSDIMRELDVEKHEITNIKWKR